MVSGPGIKPAYMHSFFRTADYIVLVIWGSHMSGMGLSIITQQNMVDALAPWDSAQKNRWFVIDNKPGGRGLVAEFESPASFCFHSVNAWQEGNDIVCEFSEYENTDIIHGLYYENMMSNGANAEKFAKEKGNSHVPNMVRYRLVDIPGQGEKTSLHGKGEALPLAEKITSIPKHQSGDLPTINPSFSTRETRYIYSIINRGFSSFLDGISKVDMKTKEVLYWDNPKGHTPGEAIFVPNPEGEAEDDGVLLSVVLDGFSERSYLVVIDAVTMEEVGRADVGPPCKSELQLPLPHPKFPLSKDDTSNALSSNFPSFNCTFFSKLQPPIPVPKMHLLTCILTFTLLLTTLTHGHGIVTSPPPRTPGPASLSLCGPDITNLIKSDNQSGTEILHKASVADPLYTPSCNIFLCKGLQLSDNLPNIQKYKSGEVVTMRVWTRIPHIGWASVAVVDAREGNERYPNLLVGKPLLNFETGSLTGYAVGEGVGDDGDGKEVSELEYKGPPVDMEFNVTIPEGLEKRCAVAGDCVLQWTWFGRVVKQTYESCIDFVVVPDKSSVESGVQESEHGQKVLG
ncbi:hypothetical protein G7Y89_g10365 [Cudoniella acicularis]|uniref:Uncharacterized protein n=1 Tax=Cudoniella acicularis TaxID=354080 RepID=A0A8H4RE08_9HELO|nr:hypothetical protein G7Y89_g10365 [Cudoniella acicularis]